ncbi:MAG: ketosteroid isomerase-related protein [Pseudomonadota bacterium]
MSATATADLIKSYFDAFNASDYDALEALLDEDVVHDINQGGREIGREAFRRFNAMMAGSYSETIRDIEIMVSANGNRAAAEFTVEGIYLQTAPGLPEATGQKYVIPAGIFFDIDDGKISRVTTYYNVEAWKDQVA